MTASFFVAMGPDNSGKALRRMFRNPGFLRKMVRTRAVALYGLRTILSGTLLPARPIGPAFPALLRELADRGFEVGIHGFDHVRWQDEIETLAEEEIELELERAFEVYRRIFGRQSSSFAAPGWRVNDLALKVLSQFRLHYQSNTRGRRPYRCRVGGEILEFLEIPSTMPTLDEIVGRRGLRNSSDIVAYYLRLVTTHLPNVHTVHAEVEGGPYNEVLRGLIRGLKKLNARFLRLDELAREIDPRSTPVCSVERGFIEGRAGWVSVQGSEGEAPQAA